MRYNKTHGCTLYSVMYLVIDIGNTAHKLAVYDESGHQVALVRQSELDISALKDVFGQFSIQAALLSSVGSVSPDVVAWLEQHTRLVKFSPALHLPIRLNYDTISTLGTDRIASAVGANALFPAQPTLAIQAGTCLVTDFVDEQGTYQGGSIAPGLRMRFQALHDHTAHLPLLEPQHPVSCTGKSTQESILSGVVYGMACEIDGTISYYQALYPDLHIILTGGDADFLIDFIKNRIFAAPNLVLEGLYKILMCNVE